ncbi:MAG: hypothetical protein IKY52_00125 [Clostridia bacterium]|nr:hypothetical protein [Clostridia bacterium]
MKTVYLLLTRSSTIFSRLIRLCTGAFYTHVSLSVGFSESARSECGFYSFGRKHSLLWFPAGFVREDRDGGFFRRFPRTPCTLLALDVPDDTYRKIRVMLEQMIAHQRLYRYNLIGALLCGLGIRYERPGRYFCSQFAGEILQRSHAAHIPKPAALMQPADYLSLPGIRTVFSGTVGERFGYVSPRRDSCRKMQGILAFLPGLCYTEARTNK